MTHLATEPCPGEGEAPYPAPGPVEDAETLVRFISTRKDTIWDGVTMRVSPGSFSSDDIKGAKGRNGVERSVSMFRRECTLSAELFARAERTNKETDWIGCPVVALTTAAFVRKMRDGAERREFCVYAEPVDEADDPSGPCTTHAGLKRSKPERPDEQRVNKNILRDRLAGAFDELRHLRPDGSVGGMVA